MPPFLVFLSVESTLMRILRITLHPAYVHVHIHVYMYI